MYLVFRRLHKTTYHFVP